MGTELVPGWVNPLVLGGTALCTVALTTAATQAFNTTRTPRPPAGLPSRPSP
ncbi:MULTISPECIES: hypothetical protein [unclassified Streptomyces]|uniref:hypothetical protein n=1 Tax=unclassified Streptomyces TaxID=2593676 RepID=UPI002E7672A2|nr:MULTISPECIES: hypothetical protein [unclassified Streptomyces]MEE1765913.1 hypothetical protein [Streptomyces sp. SP18BB07]MEE1832364.1 hypothetical protein [Streptomyces sp. SP17KL33]